MSQTYTLRVDAWGQEKELEIFFPQEWNVTFSPMEGHNATPLTDEQMWEAFSNPISSLPIHIAAKGKNQVVILFDDFTRPTPSHQIVPFILEELRKADIRDDQIRFVAAIGAHRPLDSRELMAKLGCPTVQRFRVFNHNAFDHLVHVGTTTRGTRVLLNREVANCDYKIGVGCVIPHLSAGFSGGGKLLSVGSCSIETLLHSHLMVTRRGVLDGTKDPRAVTGKVEQNPFRADLDEAAEIAGLDMKVDAVINGTRKIVGLFVGDPRAEYRTAVDFARRVYTTRSPPGMDVIVANTYPVEGQPEKASWAGEKYLRRGGTFVAIEMAACGHLPHYLIGRFGMNYGGPVWEPTRGCRIKEASRALVLSPYLSRVDKEWWGQDEHVVWCESWEQILIELKKTHGNGKGTHVGIFPTATIQCPPLFE